MEVLNKQLTLLTNFEVLRLVNESKKQEDKKAKNDRSKHLSTILYETSKYLKTTPAQEQNPEVIEKLIRAVAPYKLTAAETMQLINLRPTTAAENNAKQLGTAYLESAFKADSNYMCVIMKGESNIPTPGFAKKIQNASAVFGFPKINVANHEGLAPSALSRISFDRPSLQIQLIVEESEERIKTEEKLESLVATVIDCLPSRPNSSMAT